MQRIPKLVILLISTLLFTACGGNDRVCERYPYGHYEDDDMIGLVWEVNKAENRMTVDISEWEKRDHRGSFITMEGYSFYAQLNDETIIKHENGTKATIDDLKKGQKVLLNPPRENSFEGEPDEVILLDMSYEERYSRLLSNHNDRLNIVVMFEDGRNLPFELQDPMFANISNILVDSDRRPVGAWVPYDENFIVDYKKELDIEQFPVILVFNSEELLFKSYHVDELYNFFEGLREEN